MIATCKRPYLVGYLEPSAQNEFLPLMKAVRLVDLK
jgi:hypothetical protein